MNCRIVRMCTFVHIEALETILTFSKNAEELLKRKKVQRDLIFKYLANEGLPMPPNSEKHQLVRRTLEFWSPGKVRGCVTVLRTNATLFKGDKRIQTALITFSEMSRSSPHAYCFETLSFRGFKEKHFSSDCSQQRGRC